MSRRYNLRNRSSPKESPYKQMATDDEESEEADSMANADSQDETEHRRTPKRKPNIKHRSPGDTDHLSSQSYESSPLSSTGSDSFSYYSGSQASRVDNENSGRLYPTLTSPDSPVGGRHVIHKSSPHSFPGKEISSPGLPIKHSAALKRRVSLQSQKPLHPYRVCDMSTSYMMILLLFLFSSILAKMMFFPPESPLSATPDRFNVFCEGVDRLRTVFPEQNKQFWRVVKASAKHVFDSEEATYPAVLLMVSQKKTSNNAVDVANAITVEYDSNINVRKHVDTDMSLDLRHTPNDVDKQKLAVDTWLKKRLDSGHSVVLDHLEALVPEAALLLHGYCDGDNAPFKQAMLTLVLYLDQPVNSPEAAEKALHNLWFPAIPQDKIAALLTRVANNIVIIQS